MAAPVRNRPSGAARPPIERSAPARPPVSRPSMRPVPSGPPNPSNYTPHAAQQDDVFGAVQSAPNLPYQRQSNATRINRVQAQSTPKVTQPSSDSSPSLGSGPTPSSGVGTPRQPSGPTHGPPSAIPTLTGSERKLQPAQSNANAPGLMKRIPPQGNRPRPSAQMSGNGPPAQVKAATNVTQPSIPPPSQKFVPTKPQLGKLSVQPAQRPSAEQPVVAQAQVQPAPRPSVEQPVVAQAQVHPPEGLSEDQGEVQEQDPWSLEWSNDEWQVDQADQGDRIPFDNQAPELEQPLEQYSAQDQIPFESESQVLNDPMGLDAAAGGDQGDPWGLNYEAQDYGEPFLDPSQYDAELENLMSAVVTDKQSPQNVRDQFDQQTYAQEGTLDGAGIFQGYEGIQNSGGQETEFLPDGIYDTQSFLPEHDYALQEGHAGGDFAQDVYAQGDYAGTEYVQGDYAGVDYAQGDYAGADYAQSNFDQGDYVQGTKAQGDYAQDQFTPDGNSHPQYVGYDYAQAEQPGEEYAQDPYSQGEYDEGNLAWYENAQHGHYESGQGIMGDVQPSSNLYGEEDVYAVDAYAEPEQQALAQLPSQPSAEAHNQVPASNLVTPEVSKPVIQQKPPQRGPPVQTARRTVPVSEGRSDASMPHSVEPPSSAASAGNIEILEASSRPLGLPKTGVRKSGPLKMPYEQLHKAPTPAGPPAQRKAPPYARSPTKSPNKLLSPPMVAERVQPPPSLMEPLSASSLNAGDDWGWNDGIEAPASEAADDAWGWDGEDQEWQKPEMVEDDTYAQKPHVSPSRVRSKPISSSTSGKAGVKAKTKSNVDKVSRSDPVQERLGKSVPIASFGVGGKLIVHLPQSKAEGDAYEYDTPRIMRQVHIRPLVGYMGARPFSTLDMQKFPGPLMESSKSSHKGKKAAILKYLHEQIAESASGVGYLRRKSALFSSETPISEQGYVEEWRRMEDKILLLKLLALLVENDGQWNASGSMATTVCNLLTGRSEETELGAFSVPTYSRTSSQSAMKRPIRTYALRQGFLEELQPMLQQGDLQRAVDYAMEEKMWAHAMTISQQLDSSVRTHVIKEFIRYELDETPADSMLQKDFTSIKVAYGLYSNQSSDQITAMFRDATNLSPEAQHVQWRHAVATLIANHNVANGYETIVNAIGESLMANGLPEAAHVCYLLSHQYRKWLGSASSPFLLLGTTSLTPVSALVNDMDALLMTEVLEFILCLSHPKGAEPFSGIPALAPFKLMRAIVCDELGDTTQAKKYCEALAQLSQTKGTAQVLPPSVQLELHEFMARLNGPRADENHSWSKKLQRPTLDGVWGALEGRLTKFIAGEEMTPEAQPTKTAGKGVGAFTHYSAITPEVASSEAASGNDAEVDKGFEAQPQNDREHEIKQDQESYAGSTALHTNQDDGLGGYAHGLELNKDGAQEILMQDQYDEGAYAEEEYPDRQYPEGEYAEGQYPDGEYVTDQYPDGQRTASEYPEEQFSGGEYPDGQHVEGEYPEAEYPEGQLGDGEYAEGEYATGEYPEAELPEGQYDEGDYAEGDYPEGGHAEGEYPEAEYPEGEYAEGEYAEGEYPQGEYAEGEYVEGEYAEGEYPQGEYAEGEYAEGEYAEGEYPEGEYAEGEYAEGEYAEGEYAEGDYPQGEYAEGEYVEGEYAEGEYPQGEYAEGEYAEGEYAEGEYPEGEYAEGEYAEGDYPQGEYAEGEYPEAEYPEGEYPEGEHPEGEYPEGHNNEDEYAGGEYEKGESAEGDYAEGKHTERHLSQINEEKASDPGRQADASVQLEEQETVGNGSKPSEPMPVSNAENADPSEQSNASKPPLLHRVDAEVEPEVGEDGLLSTMPIPTLGPVSVSAPKQETNNAKGIEDVKDVDDDLGLGNTSHKEPEKLAETNEQEKSPAENAPKKPAEKASGNSWLGRLLGSRGNTQNQSDKEGKASKAHLGEETSFYYDKDLKRWVNKKAGDDGKAAPAALPPPPKAAPKPAATLSEKQVPPAPQKKLDVDVAESNTVQTEKTSEKGYGDPPVRKPAASKSGDRPPAGGASKKRPLKSRYIVVD